LEDNLEEERLQKFIANQGICSRRKAEEYITSGRIKVNGNTVIELGTKINSAKDIVEIDGKKISNITGKKVYILLNICSTFSLEYLTNYFLILRLFISGKNYMAYAMTLVVLICFSVGIMTAHIKKDELI